MVGDRMRAQHGFREWTVREARDWIRVPSCDDDKYSRGVLGVVTGSAEFPGAAVLSVDAALHTGLGMVRYLGTADQLVLARRPEAVIHDGRSDAWLLGSGMSEPDARSRDAAAEGKPTVLDAGAISLAKGVRGATVITPHAGELASLLGCERTDVEADRAAAIDRAVDMLEVTVMLKGHTTLIGDANGARLCVTARSSWLATAGTGDALAGILGALVATHAQQATTDPGALAALAATAARLHAAAAELARGPFTVLDLCEAIPLAVRHCLGGDS